MSTTAAADGDGLRKIVVRIDSVFLYIAAFTALINAYVGWQGSGPYELLAGQPWGYVGLHQAYLLMALIVTVALIGSARWGGRLWNATLLIGHLAPLSAIVIANDVFVQTDSQHFANLGLAIHLPLIALEIFALLWKAPFFTGKRRRLEVAGQ